MAVPVIPRRNAKQQQTNHSSPGVTEAEAVHIMIEHLQGLFPKSCPNCERRFATLREFYLQTTPAGTPVSYDLELDDLKPQRPVGAVAVSNCPCGSSLALTSDGMPLFRLWALLLWARSETSRRGITTTELLQHLRTVVRQQVIAKSV
jgi:hypothetical protein